jgi:hypothetical protein
VILNGQISATPVEVVRVWLGQYDAGDAVIADYSSEPVQFDLTRLFSGTATLNDDLSGWSQLSSNASVIDSYAKQRAMLTGSSGGHCKQDPSVLATDPISVEVVAAFSVPLSVAAVTYLSTRLISLFPANLKPNRISFSRTSLQVVFRAAGDVLRAVGSDMYEAAVNSALATAKQDPRSGLAGETWSLTDTRIAFTYGV